MTGTAARPEAIPGTLYEATDDTLTIRGLPTRRPSRSRTTVLSPERNTKLMGLYRTSARLLHPVRSRRLPPHHPTSGSPGVLAVYNVNIIAGQGFRTAPCFRTATISAAPTWATAVILPPGSIRIRSRAIFRARCRRSGGRRGHLHHRSARRRAQDLCRARQGPRAAYAMDALKRSMKGMRKSSGREYDLDNLHDRCRFHFKHGPHGEQGSTSSTTIYVLADPETADRCGLCQYRGDHRPRYFPTGTGNRITCPDWFQLCLRKALPSIAPRVFRRHAFARREADRRSAALENPSSSQRMPAPRPSGAPEAIPAKSIISTRRTVYEEGIRGHADDRDDPRPTTSKGNGPLLRASRRPGGNDRGFRSLLRGCERPRPQAVLAMVPSPAGTPLVTASGTYDASSQTYTLSFGADRSADARAEQPGTDAYPAPLRLAASGRKRGKASPSPAPRSPATYCT